MDRRQRYGAGAAVAGVIIAVLAAVAMPRKGSEPPPSSPSSPSSLPKVFPARDPPPHPFIPSEPRVEQPKAFCEARDISKVGGQLRATHARAVGIAKGAPKPGGPADCHADPAARELAGALNALIGRTGACVARDSELDSEWSQLESAVAALDRCIECTHPRDDRLTGCKRVLELVNAAEKATKSSGP
jgi:hypothetical protein